MEVHFVVAQEDGRSKKFRLANEEYVVIGRSKTLCQVYLEDTLCSSTHTKISVQNNAIFIEDMNSKNGVFLNGVRILKQRIYIDDKVRFGNSILFINHSRMDEKSVKASTYHGKGSRRNNLTLELDSKSSSNTFGSFKKVLIGGETNRNQKRTPKKEDRALVSQMQIKNAYLIDLLIALLIFVLANVIFYLIFPNHYKASEELSIFVRMFKGTAVKYTLASFIISIAVHFINIRIESGSIGKKILGIN